jgi:hypothetical protein
MSRSATAGRRRAEWQSRRLPFMEHVSIGIDWNLRRDVTQVRPLATEAFQSALLGNQRVPSQAPPGRRFEAGVWTAAN